MSRHRAVRGMNLDDEYDDEDDYYGHSVEDNFCISPGTAAQFTFNRGQHTFATYMGGEEAVEEESEEEAEKEEVSTTKVRSQLSDVNKAQLNSCLEEIHNILGESRPDSVYIDTVIKHNYILQSAIDELLSQKEAPKPQREPRQNRRNRSQGESDEDNDISDSQIEASEHDSDRVLSKTCQCKEENCPISVTNLSKPLSNMSLADLAKCQKGSQGLKVNQDWLQNNVCQSSTIPKVSGLTMAFGHMKAAENASSSEETEVFESNSVGGGQQERKQVLDSSGRSPKSSLSSSTGSEPGISLSQLASMHQQQKSSGTSLAALAAGQRSRQQTSLGSLQQVSQSNRTIGSLQGQLTLSSGPTVSLSNLISKNQMSGPSASLSLADLAKQHSSTKQATMSLSDLAKSRNNPSSQGLSKLVDNDNPKIPTSSNSYTSIGLSLSQLANSQKSGPGSLGQASLSSGVSLSGLANVHLQPGGVSLLSCLKSDPQTTSLSNLTKNKIQLSKLQFSSEERTPSPEVEMIESPMYTENILLLTPIHCDTSLLSMPSVLGKALCLLKNRKRKIEDCNIKYPRFAYSAQSKRCKYQSPLHKQQIKVFDFSTPSPDDLVKQKQKGAFTRTGERHIST